VRVSSTSTRRTSCSSSARSSERRFLGLDDLARLDEHGLAALRAVVDDAGHAALQLGLDREHQTASAAVQARVGQVLARGRGDALEPGLDVDRELAALAAQARQARAGLVLDLAALVERAVELGAQLREVGEALVQRGERRRVELARREPRLQAQRRVEEREQARELLALERPAERARGLERRQRIAHARQGQRHARLLEHHELAQALRCGAQAGHAVHRTRRELAQRAPAERRVRQALEQRPHGLVVEALQRERILAALPARRHGFGGRHAKSRTGYGARAPLWIATLPSSVSVQPSSRTSISR
jgi:hypothetical protein